MALYKTNPTDFDNEIEISGGGYVRQQIVFSTPTQVGGVGTITNNNGLAFHEATADWTSAGFGVYELHSQEGIYSHTASSRTKASRMMASTPSLKMTNSM